MSLLRLYGGSLETPKNDVGYTGHKFDADIGLSYMQARYYDPEIGRFYSNDPVGVLGHDSIVHGFNRYAYANNNPYLYTDPDGQKPDIFESRKRHQAAQDKVSNRLRKQGYTVQNDVRHSVNMGGGKTKIRIMDIVATKGSKTRNIEIKTMKENTSSAKGKGKANIGKNALSLGGTVVRGAFQLFQIKKDQALIKNGGTNLRTGEAVDPGSSVEWVGFKHDGKKLTKELPPVKVPEG